MEQDQSQSGRGVEGPGFGPDGFLGGSPELAVMLKGDLPCVRCRYNLRGLSVAGVCPECGTPMRATLLALVDPRASELRPLPRPRLTAWGIIAWAAGAFGAALAVWLLRLADAVPDLGPAAVWWVGVRELFLGAGVVCLVASGLGALVLVRPHGGIAATQRARTLAAASLYAPLILLYWWMHGRLDPISPAPFVQTEAYVLERTMLRLAQGGLIVLIIWGLRPAARMLAARSLVMRHGRADRQTMLALAGAFALAMAGDLIQAASVAAPGYREVFLWSGTIVIAAGSVLATVGLGWIVLDVARLCPVLLEPSPSPESVLEVEGWEEGQMADGPEGQRGPAEGG